MPIYSYKAIDQRGRQSKGNIDADTAREARDKLRHQQLRVTDMERVHIAPWPAGFIDGASEEEIGSCRASAARPMEVAMANSFGSWRQRRSW